MGRRVQASDAKRAVAYYRCSTDTERQALGIEAQRHAVREYAARLGIEIVAEFTEEVSGGAPLDRRPVLLEALGAVAAHGAGHLLVHRLDRFSREPLTAALAESELRRHGAALAIAEGAGAGDDPTAELVRGILLSVARFEKAMIQARIKGALAVRKRAGKRVGTVPFGMHADADGSLTADDAEQGVISSARALRKKGLSVRAVAEELARSGHVGRSGRPLAAQQVHRLLQAPQGA